MEGYFKGFLDEDGNATASSREERSDWISIIEMFERQVGRTPGAAAVELGASSFSYQELNRRANGLAQVLVKSGLGPGKLAAVCMERSLEMVVALVAILKVGGAYVSLDPAYPRERLAFMLHDASPAVLLVDDELAKLLPVGAVECIPLRRIRRARASNANPTRRTGPDDLVYLIYTSGSTGTPKGVAMGQRALCNLLKWQLQSWSEPAAARTLQFASINFDVAFQEIFSTLAAGGTLVLVSEEMRRDFGRLLVYLGERKVERIFLPFIALQQLAEAAEGKAHLALDLREVITAGEQLQITRPVRSLFSRFERCVLRNQYGPSETHVITEYTLEGAPDTWPSLPPIGQAIANTHVRVLDEEGRPLPHGETGELYLGGVCLAHGYFNRPELTRERFIRQDGERLYKSGDLGRVLPDGNIEFLGRADHQVKIRGYRVELGEIEVALGHHTGVQVAVVALINATSVEEQLVAYVVPKGGGTMPAPEVLRGFLAQIFPPYMVPSLYMRIDSLPLTPSGKVNRRALPMPGLALPSKASTRETKAPETPLERELVALWTEFFGIRSVGTCDDFFELGGHSLLAARMVDEIGKRTGHRVSIANLFEAPTIERLARLLEDDVRGQNAFDCSLVGLRTEGSKPPFFCIADFLDLSRYLDEEQPYYALDGKLDDLQSLLVEASAARFIVEMRTIQPQGPYLLGGYSFGGLIAVEIARQLSAVGEKIELLVLLDPDRPFPPTAVQSLLQHQVYRNAHRLQDLINLPLEKRSAHVLKKTGRAWARLTNRLRRQYDRQAFAAHQIESKNRSYTVPEYHGDIALFLAQKPDRAEMGLCPKQRAWERVARGRLDVYEVPGDHLSFFKEPNVRVLAGKLQRCLDTAAHHMVHVGTYTCGLFAAFCGGSL